MTLMSAATHAVILRPWPDQLEVALDADMALVVESEGGERRLMSLRLPRGQVDLRAEVFNVINRTNYDLPDSFFGSPTFGKILGAGSPRRFQFGVRTIF